MGPFLENLSRLTVAFDEVIFYDDASTDDTADRLREKGFPVIKGLVNRGPGYARNRLAAAAQSEYIHFHDVDDELIPEFLRLIKDRTAAGQADVVVGSADWICAVSRKTFIRWQYSEAECRRDALAYFITHPLGIINTIYKRNIFLHVNGFDEDIRCWEDADLHIRLAAASAKFSIIPDLLAFSLRHDRGVSSNQSRCWHCRLRFLRRYMAAYPQIGHEIFENELQKAKNGLIATAGFRYLREVARIKSDFQLQLQTRKIMALYYLDRLIPGRLLPVLLKFFRRNKR